MNLYNKISASFTLKTSDLPLTPGSNTIGTLNNTYRSSMTWSNLDIQSILGEMWNKFSYFRIVLVSGLTSSLTTVHTPDTIVTVNLQGLQFVNSAYSVKSKSISNSALIGVLTFVATAGASYQGKDVAFIMFKKERGVVNLTITLNTVHTNNIATALLFQNTEGNAIFSHQCYTFRIEGVE